MVLPHEVFLVGDEVAPLGFGLFAVGADTFPHGQVGHKVIRCCAVPVPLARRGVDGVAGPYDNNLAAAGLDEPDALGDMQGLVIAPGMMS